MMNKCKRRIVQGDYIMGNIFHKKKDGRKIEEEKNVNNQHCIGTLFYKLIVAFVSSHIEI